MILYDQLLAQGIDVFESTAGDVGEGEVVGANGIGTGAGAVIDFG